MKRYYYYYGSVSYLKKFDYGFIAIEGVDEKDCEQHIDSFIKDKISITGELAAEDNQEILPKEEDYDNIDDYHKDFRETCMSIRYSTTYDAEDITSCIENQESFSYQCDYAGREKIMTPEMFKDIIWEEEY